METFSKREKEKARRKKKQDKEEKREERKANATSGSLDEMMAYVDEYGNITTTPPDPRRKRATIELEDIQIGVAKQEDIVQDAERQGIVTFFNTSKGYGFIRDLQSQDSIFVHINSLIDAVGENDKVTFEVTMTPKGANAVQVKKLVAPAPAAPATPAVATTPAEPAAPTT